MNDDLIEVEIDLPGPVEQALRDRAAEADVSLNLFLVSVISRQVARDDGKCRGDYRYSGH